jgi:DNA repair protein RadC
MPIPPPPIDAVRTHIDPSDADGALRVLYVDAEGVIIHVAPVSEGAHSADEFFARYLADLVASIGAPAAVLVINRRAGRPTRVDRALWQAVRARTTLGGTRLLDVVVAGTERCWSARAAAR